MSHRGRRRIYHMASALACPSLSLSASAPMNDIGDFKIPEGMAEHSPLISAVHMCTGGKLECISLMLCEDHSRKMLCSE